jgi:hypothetical protein
MTTGHDASRLTTAKFWFYVKIAAVVVVAVYLLSFVLINFSNKAEVWLLPGLQLKTTSLWVILLTAGLTLLARYLVKWLAASFRQMRRNRNA